MVILLIVFINIALKLQIVLDLRTNALLWCMGISSFYLYNIPMNYFCQKDKSILANNGVVSTLPSTLRPQIIICPFPLLHFPTTVLFL